MADQAELVFVRTFIKTIANHPVTFPDDYQQPLQDWPKKVPILPVVASIDITFKSLKPPQSFTLSVQPTDSISGIKSQLASQPRAPRADAQRLLLKGKALADNKLLKEYNVKDGDTINLMVKPGFDWDPSTAPFPSSEPETKSLLEPDMKSSLSSDSLPKLSTGFRHTRTPSIVLSPSPSVISLEPEGKPQDINLTLDTSSIPTASLSPATQSSYQATICEPEFWENLLSFLRQFNNDNDALVAFENFLCASKGAMSKASDIARIRDYVGVSGMAGT
ncbi:hypothetical protein F5J12DRAFT_814326 [Pisolithus orientalis]|uniref:uncharacterized protein n=1 Tax=Pisolithus orientalis TaxID=936130 RepID=UPI00222422DF|nr:uncharacterized protein F5J12DRAFT_814326 [Pisolithus orientalis]KAI6019953.1 hypothetical protein F5J12DRAFT_814326 [Pisolithus orientalis]